MERGQASSRYRPAITWILGIAIMTAVVAFPLFALERVADDTMTIDLINTESTMSGILKSGNETALFVNTWSPAEARSFYGRVTRPWQDAPRIVIAPDTDRAAPGTLEVLERIRPELLIVIGIPGADPNWLAIERWCRSAGTEVTWVADIAQFRLGSATVTVIASTSDVSPFRELLIQGPSGTVALQLSHESSMVATDIRVAPSPHDDAYARLHIHTRPSERPTKNPTVLIDSGKAARVVFEDDHITVYGGSLISEPGK